MAYSRTNFDLYLSEDVENYLKMGVRGWRKMAKDGDAWKLMLDTRVLHGPYSQYRERKRETNRLWNRKESVITVTWVTGWPNFGYSLH